MTLPYTGSGPYCYSNCLSMMLGNASPDPSRIEVLTGSPFGTQLLAGQIPLFDPYGWDPDLGIDAALSWLGWRCQRTTATNAETATEALREAVSTGPVMAGPIDMGELRYQPGMTGPIGADHWVIVLDIDDDRVVMHDPHGHPYATLPLTQFLQAWNAGQIPWIKAPFVMRTNFSKTADIDIHSALRASLPTAAKWLTDQYDGDMPPSTLGTAEAMQQLADMTETGLNGDTLEHLVHFAVRIGARRLNDAAVALTDLGIPRAAQIAARQSRLLGSLQYDLVAGNNIAAANTMRNMAPGYSQLAAALN